MCVTVWVSECCIAAAGAKSLARKYVSCSTEGVFEDMFARCFDSESMESSTHNEARRYKEREEAQRFECLIQLRCVKNVLETSMAQVLNGKTRRGDKIMR